VTDGLVIIFIALPCLANRRVGVLDLWINEIESAAGVRHQHSLIVHPNVYAPAITVTLADRVTGLLQQLEDFSSFVPACYLALSVTDDDLLTKRIGNTIITCRLINIVQKISLSVSPPFVEIGFPKHQFRPVFLEDTLSE